MSKRLRRYPVVACVLVLLAGLAHSGTPAEDPGRDEGARQVATEWFTSLMQGRTAVATSLSDVPFSFDGKQEVKTLAELRKLYDGIVAKKGKRDLKPTEVKIKSSAAEKVVVMLMIGDEGIAVTVKPGPAPRVTGFRD